jgi:hypothetical protein
MPVATRHGHGTRVAPRMLIPSRRDDRGTIRLRRSGRTLVLGLSRPRRRGTERYRAAPASGSSRASARFSSGSRTACWAQAGTSVPSSGWAIA